MFFYLLVAAALALRVPILRLAVPGMVLVAALSFVIPVFASAIAIEFLYGVCIGMAWQGGTLHVRDEPVVATFLLAAGFVSILAIPVVSGTLRPLSWGIPATCIVIGAVMLEPRLRQVLPRWLLALGNGSYAIYLLHGFIVPAALLVALKAGLTPAASLAATLFVSLLVSALAGHFTHVWLEQPMLNWFRRPAAPSVAVAG
jgi:peptidoglycan/LPS O-acetylase OafA/YrhL